MCEANSSEAFQSTPQKVVMLSIHKHGRIQQAEPSSKILNSLGPLCPITLVDTITTAYVETKDNLPAPLRLLWWIAITEGSIEGYGNPEWT